MKLSKLIFIALLWATIITACQADIESTIEAEVIAGVQSTIEALPTSTSNPTFTPNPTLTTLPTIAPIEFPTPLFTLTPRPTYTPYPTFTPIPSPTPLSTIVNQNIDHSNSNTNISGSSYTTLSPSLISITGAKMNQILDNVSGSTTTYKDENPDDVLPGESKVVAIPIDCHSTLNNYNELLQLEIKNFSSENLQEQAAYGLYRQAWEHYMTIINPIIARCQMAITNQEILNWLGDMYILAKNGMQNKVEVLINQAIHTLEEGK